MGNGDAITLYVDGKNSVARWPQLVQHLDLQVW